MADLFESSVVLEIAATEQHVATVILCHGMGESAEQWHKLALRWSWSDCFPHIKFVFPQAPKQPVKFLGNVPMTAWFDVPTTNDIEGGNYNAESQRLARNYLERLIKDETNHGIGPERIYIGGYSQGGALALSFSVYNPSVVGGVFAISAYLPMLPQMKEVLCTATTTQGGDRIRRPAYFISHGTNDQYVKYPWAEWTVEALRDGGNEVDFRTYLRGGHRIQTYTRRDLEGWLRDQIPYGDFQSF